MNKPVDFERTPPQNIELEMCVLGGIMLEPKEAYPLVAGKLRPEHFYLDGHGIIFKLMGELSARGIPPDSVALLDELRARDLLDKVGGSGVIMGMLNSVPTAASVEYHARKVVEKYNLREIIRIATRAIMAAYDQQDESANICERTIKELLDLAVDEHLIGNCPAVAAEWWDEIIRKAQYIREQREAGNKKAEAFIGYRTGIYDFDKITGGLIPGEETLIAARPGQGKTALMLNVLCQIALAGTPTAIVSMEMSYESLMSRIISHLAYIGQPAPRVPVTVRQLRGADLLPQEWRSITEGYAKALELPLFLISAGRQTPNQLRSYIQKLVCSYGVKVVGIDYLQRMKPNLNTDNRVGNMSEISADVKDFAQDYNIALLVASQLKRPDPRARDKEPELEDLRETGAIEQDADNITFLWGDLGNNSYELRPVSYLLKKCRQGVTRVSIQLLWCGGSMTFMNHGVRE